MNDRGGLGTLESSELLVILRDRAAGPVGLGDRGLIEVDPSPYPAVLDGGGT